MSRETPAHAALMVRLAHHRLLRDAPPAEQAWLATHGVLRTHDVGDVITAKGEQAVDLIVVLSGHMVIRVDRGAGMHKIFEWQAGDVGGVLPYSRSASPPNDVVVEARAELLAISRTDFPEMIRACPSITAVLVHVMIDRARQFTLNDLRDEKLVSLGKLAAGLAHELNNPASAVLRSAKLLTESIDASEAAARALGAARLSESQLAMIDEIRAMSLKAAPTVTRSAIGRSDREDEFLEWLEMHGADERCAAPLAETGVTLEAVDALARAVERPVLNATLKWMAAGCNVRALSSDIETAAARIHDLVGAVKGFTFMDHAPMPEPVDIRQGLHDTLTMLAAKTRNKSAEVTLDIDDDLPPAMAVGVELNQVWMNLIDNALDAIPDHGHVTISAKREPQHLVVHISDNGPGIPPDLLSRIFEPFFTTKGVGRGTGLGLDIVRRLLKQHDGELAVESEPGHTEFRVRLPVAG